MKSADLITQGLRLKLEPLDSSGDSKAVECAVIQFKPVMEPDKLSFTLSNVGGMPRPFPKRRG